MRCISWREPLPRGRHRHHRAHPQAAVLEGALRLARGGTRGQHVVADHQRDGRARAGEPGTLDVPQAHRAGEIGLALPRVEAGLVEHAAVDLEHWPDGHRSAVAPQSSGRNPRYPQHRVVSSGAHHLCARGDRHQDDRSAAENGPCRGSQGRSEWGSQREHGVLLVGKHHRAQERVILTGREAAGQAGRARRGPDRARVDRESRCALETQRPAGSVAPHTATTEDEVEPGIAHTGTMTRPGARQHRRPGSCGPTAGARALWMLSRRTPRR